MAALLMSQLEYSWILKTVKHLTKNGQLKRKNLLLTSFPKKTLGPAQGQRCPYRVCAAVRAMARASAASSGFGVSLSPKSHVTIF